VAGRLATLSGAAWAASSTREDRPSFRKAWETRLSTVSRVMTGRAATSRLDPLGDQRMAGCGADQLTVSAGLPTSRSCFAESFDRVAG